MLMAASASSSCGERLLATSTLSAEVPAAWSVGVDGLMVMAASWLRSLRDTIILL